MIPHTPAPRALLLCLEAGRGLAQPVRGRAPVLPGLAAPAGCISCLLPIPTSYVNSVYHACPVLVPTCCCQSVIPQHRLPAGPWLPAILETLPLQPHCPWSPQSLTVTLPHPFSFVCLSSHLPSGITSLAYWCKVCSFPLLRYSPTASTIYFSIPHFWY